ncbi:MAG: hypothetical protein A2W93_13145 [Bacteroidetes bacterium GWF2_43_63]|nr:MAG: hypothetical protein A2W94_03460 [Bacteroidetes bacterium GWE2_42_42]OFY55129.1 MAG: hypothetical protein A2W93_13145 [Bacteroidetes bacterium GWF2_43_63]HBG70252.1 hypothetical protein [Bacteroidales bacterium]HCB63076.1 hypothetical protein [Bacteroidales bacterium]HCY22705.1 hypothetical protein [Bacteroidales bacterium]
MKIAFALILSLVFYCLQAQQDDFSVFTKYTNGDTIIVNTNPTHQTFDDTIGMQHSSINSYRFLLYRSSGNKTAFINKPLASAEVMAGSDFSNKLNAGLISGFVSGKFSAVAFPSVIFADYPMFVAEKFDSMNVFPYQGKTLFSSGNAFGVLSVPVYLKYDLGNILSLEGGNGKAFLGDGYRSMLLSDQSAEYPFLRIVADMKQVKYMHQIARWRQQSSAGNNETKFAATHYLSWMITKKLNVSVFESVIWKAEDSVRQRGFEWLYLNPVMFFRPAEFALGSPDNNLLGGNISWYFLPKTKVYGQFVLDEFFISEIKNWLKHLMHPDDPTIQHGAWVNKQAFQLGVKSMDVFGIHDLNCLAEFNYARPYIGSHRDPMLSNTHMNQPIAHPFGANFYEFVFRTQYKKQKWSAHLNAMFCVTGLDSAGTHFGQDLLQSTFDSPQGNGNIPVQYYGNVVGQGIRHDVIQVNAEFRKQLFKMNNNIIWRIGAMYRNDMSAFNNTSEKYIYTGLFLNLQPDEWNMR